MFNLISRYALHLTFLFMAVITWLSLYPVEFPEMPGNDKTSHFIAYAACVLPVSFARPKTLYLILLAVLVWSGLMELIQPYVNRYADWLDLAANAGGIVIGFLMGWGLNRVWPKSGE